MKALSVCIILALLTGCSVNVVVAPDATVFVDDNAQTIQAKAVTVLPE